MSVVYQKIPENNLVIQKHDDNLLHTCRNHRSTQNKSTKTDEIFEDYWVEKEDESEWLNRIKKVIPDIGGFDQKEGLRLHQEFESKVGWLGRRRGEEEESVGLYKPTIYPSRGFTLSLSLLSYPRVINSREWKLFISPSENKGRLIILLFF